MRWEFRVLPNDFLSYVEAVSVHRGYDSSNNQILEASVKGSFPRALLAWIGEAKARHQYERSMLADEIWREAFPTAAEALGCRENRLRRPLREEKWLPSQPTGYDWEPPLVT
jgi:hypothetical protein